MNVRAAVMLASLVALALPATAQTTYQWKDPKTGNMIYSDQPPPTGVKPIDTRAGTMPSEERQQLYATKLAAEKYPVVLYTAADCVEHCNNARKLLNARGIPFNEKVVQTDSADAVNELKALGGGEAMVPLIKVGQQHVKGFEPVSWNNLLDLAGYPKTAPYGSKPHGAFSK